MEGRPVLLNPEVTLLSIVAFGGAAGIHQDSLACDQVVKATRGALIQRVHRRRHAVAHINKR